MQLEHLSRTLWGGWPYSRSVEFSLALWALTIAGIVALVALDFVVSGKQHVVQTREAALWSAFYIAIALAFAAGLFWLHSSAAGSEFFTAYIVEKSLSIDNLFVFAIILTRFAVPQDLQHRVLLIGIVLALIFRTVFIAVGAAAISYFAFTFVLFGALLIWTGTGLLRHRNEDPDVKDSFAVRVVKKRVPLTENFHGTKWFVVEQGRKYATPMFLVVIAVGSTDLLFALDSIPATFGVTQQAFLVFAANAFALLGLRALYFLLKGLLDRLIFLSTGLALILIFIGVKLVLAFAHTEWPQVPHISTGLSLAVIAVILAVTTIASIIVSRRDPDRIAHAGTVTKPKDRPAEPDSAPETPKQPPVKD